MEGGNQFLARIFVDVFPDDFEQHAESRQRPVVSANGVPDHPDQFLFRFAAHPLQDGLPQIKQYPHARPILLACLFLFIMRIRRPNHPSRPPFPAKDKPGPRMV